MFVYVTRVMLGNENEELFENAQAARERIGEAVPRLRTASSRLLKKQMRKNPFPGKARYWSLLVVGNHLKLAFDGSACCRSSG